MRPVLLPLVLAALLFYALEPPVDWLQKMRVPRAIAAAVMLLLVIASCGGEVYTLQGQALAVIDQLPAWCPKLAGGSAATNPIAPELAAQPTEISHRRYDHDDPWPR